MARLPFNLRRTLARCPITTVLIVIAVVLHAAVLIYRRQFPETASEAFRVLGAARMLVRVDEPDFHGLFELWDGQLWRVLVRGFHHGDLPHLAFNAVSLGFLGGLLEPRMRRPGFLAFVVAALLVSLIPEFLLEHAVVGLLGVACAMLGALLVVRRDDLDGSPSQAWRTVLQGLRGNRSNNDLLQLAQFREGPEQAEALAAIERTFPEAPEAWRERIATTAAHVEPWFPVFSDHLGEGRLDDERYALDGLFEPPPTIDVGTQGRPPMLPPIDPYAPGSAAEGVRL